MFHNIEGKITECCLVNEEGIFSEFCFMKRAKLLTQDWSSGCLATAHLIEKLFFCNNGVDEEYIEELKDKSENENTKNITEW